MKKLCIDNTSLSFSFVFATALALIMGASTTQAGPPPVFGKRAGGDLYNVTGDSVIYIFGTDSLKITPSGLYWESATILDSALLDSLHDGLGRFANINTFAELQSWVSDKTLVNKEDSATISGSRVFTNGGISIYRYNDVPGNGTFMLLQRRRDGAPTSNVSSGDYLGSLVYQGYYTTGPPPVGDQTGAIIRAIVDGAPGEGDMPGRLEFLTTPDGAATPQIRMTIDNTGAVVFTGAVTCDSITADLINVDTVVTSGDAIADFAGDNLSVTANVLNVTIPAQGDSAYWDAVADQVAADSGNWGKAYDSSQNLTANYEEESHASEHQDAGADEIAVTKGMMNAGTGASSSTFWRGDDTWATPTDNDTQFWDTTTSKDTLSYVGNTDTLLQIERHKVKMRLKITPSSANNSYTYLDTIWDDATATSWTSPVSGTDIATVCDSMVKYINLDTDVNGRVTAEDSTTYYVIKSDYYDSVFTVATDTAQDTATTQANTDTTWLTHPGTDALVVQGTADSATIAADAHTAHKDKDGDSIDVSSYLTSETGDIEGVTAGNGLEGGGTSGTVTLGVRPGLGIDTTNDLVRVDTANAVADAETKPVTGNAVFDFCETTQNYALNSELHARSHTMTSTSDHTAGNHKIFYSDGSGNVVELDHGATGLVLKSNGTALAPSWQSDLSGATSLEDVFNYMHPDVFDTTDFNDSIGIRDNAITDAKIDSLDPDKLEQDAASTGQVLKWNGTAWQPGTDNTGGAGIWDTSGTRDTVVLVGSSDTLMAVSDTGTSTSIETQNAAGFLFLDPVTIAATKILTFDTAQSVGGIQGLYVQILSANGLKTNSFISYTLNDTIDFQSPLKMDSGINMQGTQLTNVAHPTNDTDGVNKGWVETEIGDSLDEYLLSSDAYWVMVDSTTIVHINTQTGDSLFFVAVTGVRVKVDNANTGAASDLDTGLFVYMDSGGSADSAYAFGYMFGGPAFNNTQDAGFQHIFAGDAGSYYGIYLQVQDSVSPFVQPILIDLSESEFGGTGIKINHGGAGQGIHITKLSTDTAAGQLLRLESQANIIGQVIFNDADGTGLQVRNREDYADGGIGLELGANPDSLNAVVLKLTKGVFLVTDSGSFNWPADIVPDSVIPDGITIAGLGDTTKWNDAYDWGDHSTVGYENYDDSGSYVEIPQSVINAKLYIGNASDTSESDSLAATHGWVTGQGYLTSETDPVWISDSGDYSMKTWVQTEVEDSLNEYSLTSAIVAGYLAKADSGTWDEVSAKTVFNQMIMGNVSDSGEADSNVATRGYVTGQGYLTSESDPVWTSDSADYAFKTWTQAEIEDSLNEYSLTSAIVAGYLAKTDSGTWDEISAKLVLNQAIIGNASDSGETDSGAATQGYVQKMIEDSLNEYAPLASPTFTGTVTIPTPFTLGAVSVTPTGTELNFVDGVTSAIQTQLDGKEGQLDNSAGLAAALSDETGTGLAVFSTSPTFTTGVTVPNNSISDEELDEGATFNWTAGHDFSAAITTSSTIDTVDLATLAAKVHNEDLKHFIFTFSNPNAVYDTDSLLCIKPVTEKAITITRIDVTCDADPATEPAMRLSHANNFISRTTDTTIDVITTAVGVTTITSGFDDATIPASRCIYFAFTADPIAAIKSITVDITYTID